VGGRILWPRAYHGEWGRKNVVKKAWGGGGASSGYSLFYEGGVLRKRKHLRTMLPDEKRRDLVKSLQEKFSNVIVGLGKGDTLKKPPLLLRRGRASHTLRLVSENSIVGG